MKKEIRLDRLYRRIEELQDEATALRLSLREDQIKDSSEKYIEAAQPVVDKVKDSYLEGIINRGALID